MVVVIIFEMDCEEFKRLFCFYIYLERRYINEKLRYYVRFNEFIIFCDFVDKFLWYLLSSEEWK